MLPTKPVYKYLGYPHRADGIDFSEHLRHCTDKATHLFNWTRSLSFSWPSATRLLIYRTFVRPVLEYGAPLVFAEHLQHLLNFSDTTNLHNAALSWIAATRPQPNHGILETICGSTQPVDRFQDLATTFVCHLHSAHITNPIRIILPEVDALPSRLLFHAPIQETFEIAIRTKLSHPHHQPPISLKSLAQQTL